MSVIIIRIILGVLNAVSNIIPGTPASVARRRRRRNVHEKQDRIDLLTTVLAERGFKYTPQLDELYFDCKMKEQKKNPAWQDEFFDIVEFWNPDDIEDLILVDCRLDNAYVDALEKEAVSLAFESASHTPIIC